MCFENAFDIHDDAVCSLQSLILLLLFLPSILAVIKGNVHGICRGPVEDRDSPRDVGFFPVGMVILQISAPQGEGKSKLRGILSAECIQL